MWNGYNCISNHCPSSKKVTEKIVHVKMVGGELKILIDKELYMIGPAKIFNGEIELEIYLR